MKVQTYTYMPASRRRIINHNANMHVVKNLMSNCPKAYTLFARPDIYHRENRTKNTVRNYIKDAAVTISDISIYAMNFNWGPV